MAYQDVFITGSGTRYNKAVTRCSSALTGQELGRWRRMRSLYCLTCAATLKRVRMTVEGWACASGVFWIYGVGRARDLPYSPPRRTTDSAMASKAVVQLRTLWM